MKKLIKKAEKLALSEIKRYGSPPEEFFRISNHQAIKLAKKYKANQDITLVGMYFADLKLGQAISQNKQKEHTKMSAKTARDFLEKETDDKDFIESVIHCVEAHHKTIPFKSKEAEIVANADCYRFLTPRGMFVFIKSLSGRDNIDLDGIIDYVEAKAEEKWSIASLPEVIKELEPNYKLIKEFVKKARKTKH